jgi:hypothetical protein
MLLEQFKDDHRLRIPDSQQLVYGYSLEIVFYYVSEHTATRSELVGTRNCC